MSPPHLDNGSSSSPRRAKAADKSGQKLEEKKEQVIDAGLKSLDHCMFLLSYFSRFFSYSQEPGFLRDTVAHMFLDCRVGPVYPRALAHGIG
jgi:hypothetical protein